jgi:hypothetical protein
MRGAIPPLPNTPSWRGAKLRKAQKQHYRYHYILSFKLLGDKKTKQSEQNGGKHSSDLVCS